MKRGEGEMREQELGEAVDEPQTTFEELSTARSWPKEEKSFSKQLA